MPAQTLTDKYATKLTPVCQERIKKLFTKPKKKQKANKALLDKMHDEWFFKLKPAYFKQMTEEWNERNLSVVLPKLENYDEWLNHFKTLPPSVIRMLAATGQDFLTTEAYAALSRWHDIISNPHRIDKIHQSGLTSSGADKNKKTIAQLALENDRLGVLQATRDKIAEKLDKGAGSRDTALLTREMTEIMTQIADYEKRMGTNRKNTVLGDLMEDMHLPKKRPAKNGGGSRNTSFKSRTRVTIEDVK